MLLVRPRASGLAVTSADFHRAQSAHSSLPPKRCQEPSTLDSEGWTALHHACDSSSWSSRALKAALDLAQETPILEMNSGTIGKQPRGYTCLHFACDGSDKEFNRKELVNSLLNKKAELEVKDAKGNTPLLTAAGTGVSDLVKLLISRRADVNAVNYRGLGALQRAGNHSSDVARILKEAGARNTQVAGTWTNNG